VAELLNGLKLEVTKINHIIFLTLIQLSFWAKHRLKLTVCQTNVHNLITFKEPVVEPVKPCNTSGIILYLKQPPQDVTKY
jgi:hypothetical protein